MQDSTLADRLRKLRGTTSRKAFSLKYGIHEQSLIRYEKGTRIPDNNIIRRIAMGENVSFDWLRLGIGSEKNASLQNDRRVGRFEETLDKQPTEILRDRDKETADMSVIPLYEENRSLYQKNMELQEHVVELTEQLATLRIQLERRDMRIRELEKENVGLREAQKGASRVQNQIFGTGA